jgi:hypothetical protein
MGPPKTEGIMDERARRAAANFMVWGALRDEGDVLKKAA